MIRNLGYPLCVACSLGWLAISSPARAEDLPPLDNSFFAVAWVDLAKTDGPTLRQAAAACVTAGGAKTAEPVLTAWTDFRAAITANGATQFRFYMKGEEGVPHVAWEIMASGVPKQDNAIRNLFKPMNDFYFPPPANWADHQTILVTGEGGAGIGTVNQAQRQAFADAVQALPPGGALSAVIVPNPNVKLAATEIERYGPVSFRRLVTLAGDSRAIACALTLGTEPRFDLRILAKDERAAAQIKLAAQAAAADGAKLKGADPSDQLLNRFIAQLTPMQEGSAVRFTIKCSGLMPGDAALLPGAKLLRDFYFDVEVSKHLGALAGGAYGYSNEHNGVMPTKIEDFASEFDNPSLATVQFNPRTGEKAGFIFVRSGPTNTKLPPDKPMFYEAKNGVRDPNGLTEYNSGIICRGAPPKPQPIVMPPR